MTKTERIKDKMTAMFCFYQDQVEDLVAAQFRKRVVPYCQKHGYRFITGNGTWWLGTDKLGFHVDIPNGLLELLNLSVPGLPANKFGSLMPNYNPGGETDAEVED